MYESPLKAAAGLPATLVDEVEVAVERANTIAEYTRDCMESSGFEYPASTVTGAQLYNPGVFLSEAEFVEQYGFGYFAAGIDAVTGARDSRETSGSPLEQYIASLHPEARGEFFLTLYGFIPGELESTETVDRGGCEFEAEIRYNEENPISTGLETDAVLEAFEELEARLASDPRTIEATRLWSACMSAEGYSEWSSLSELRDDLSADVDRSFSNASDEDQLLDELHKGLASELEVAAVSFACEADARTLEIEARRDLESEILETLAP